MVSNRGARTLASAARLFNPTATKLVIAARDGALLSFSQRSLTELIDNQRAKKPLIITQLNSPGDASYELLQAVEQHIAEQKLNASLFAITREKFASLGGPNHPINAFGLANTHFISDPEAEVFRHLGLLTEYQHKSPAFFSIVLKAHEQRTAFTHTLGNDTTNKAIASHIEIIAELMTAKSGPKP